MSQNPSREGAEQPAVADPSLNRAIGLDDLQSSLPNSVVL